MIEELDIKVMREEGVKRFREDVENRIRSGVAPTIEFVQKSLLGALTPLLKAVAGEDAIPENHIRVHISTEVNEDGQTITLTECEGLSSYGEIAIDSFMSAKTLAEA